MCYINTRGLAIVVIERQIVYSSSINSRLTTYGQIEKSFHRNGVMMPSFVS